MDKAGDQLGYTLREAGERLGISARQVRRYVLDGRLSAVLVPGVRGREYRVDPASVDALAGERGQGGQPRKGGRIVSTTAIATLASPEVGRLVSDQLAALERAWARVAELEGENARLRTMLEAGQVAPAPQLEAQQPATTAPQQTASPGRRPRTMRDRARRLFGR